MDTLFGHLATRFAASPENIAIDALAFVLKRSEAARQAATDFFGRAGTALPADLEYRTQSGGEDRARPDIEGVTLEGQTPLIVECKFWAGLTANQPVTYLSRLPNDQSGALAFLVPTARFTSLWPELLDRLAEADIQPMEAPTRSTDMWHVRLGNGHSFVMASWRGLLDQICVALEAVHDRDTLHDVYQLIGLTERMDREAFLPFKSEELTDVGAARRYTQYNLLADEIGKTLLASGRYDNNGLTAAAGLGYSGRFLRRASDDRELVFLVCFAAEAWAEFKVSPIWVRFEPRKAAFLKRALGETASATDLSTFEKEPYAWVPVRLQVDMEWAETVSQAAEQIDGLLAELFSLDAVA